MSEIQTTEQKEAFLDLKRKIDKTYNMATIMYHALHIPDYDSILSVEFIAAMLFESAEEVLAQWGELNRLIT